MDTCAFARFAPLLRDMSESELAEEIERPNRLLLEETSVGGRRIEVAYFPNDIVKSHAQIAIVGLTPGRQQMRNALFEARRCLRAGMSESDTLSSVELFASFSGPMRANLIAMLDAIGANRLLGVRSTASLWAEDADMAYFTSALQFPVFVDGSNYSGAPSIFATPCLLNQLRTGLAVKAAQLKHAIFVPLGPIVGKAMEFIADEIDLDRRRVLTGLPHPSGANAERIAFFLGRKKQDALSNKVDAKRLLGARRELKAKVRQLAD